MKVININEEQKSKLCSRLAQLVFDLKKDKSVECIYYRICAQRKYVRDVEGDIIRIIVVTKDEKAVDYDSKTKKECEYEQEAKDFGIKIYITVQSPKSLAKLSNFNLSYLREVDLFNSIILYDRTGEYTKIKEEAKEWFEKIGEKEKKLYYYSNLAEIVPPITEELSRAIENKQLEEGTKAVKESVKSKLFQ